MITNVQNYSLTYKGDDEKQSWISELINRFMINVIQVRMLRKCLRAANLEQ